ncbi:MAG TPA: carbohydrate ABC transporter permease [Chloroflexota bacterium]|nr:carbohydrate ABC transporter permease [Chloroflexota bacterium]
MASTSVSDRLPASGIGVRKVARALATHALLVFGSVFMLIPFVWMLAASVEPEDEIFTYPPNFIPGQILIQHWIQAWSLVPFAQFFLNSGIMSVAITLGQFVTAAFAAYAFARLRFPGRDRLFLCFLATLMVPGQVLLIPQFMIIRTLGWLNTYEALIVPGLASAYAVFLLRQFFLGLPAELEDAARIDGCSPLRILWQIVVPLSMPAIITLGIFTFLGSWNAFLWPLIVATGEEMFTVQLGLQMYRSAYSNQWPYIMAAASFITLPVLILFFAGQKQFTQGIALTGLKG